MSTSSKTSSNASQRRPSWLPRRYEPSGPTWLATAYEQSVDCVRGEIHNEFLPVENACMRVTSDDVKVRGSTLVAQGTHITPQLQAMLTATGIFTVPVYRRPRVGVVLSSFDAVPHGEVQHAWQRPDSTSAYVRSLLARWGHVTPPVEQLTPEHSKDSPSDIREARTTYIKRFFDLMPRYDLLIGVGMPADSWMLSPGLGGSVAFNEGKTCIHFDNTTERGFECRIGGDRTPPVHVKHTLYRPGTLSHFAGSASYIYYDRPIVLNVPGHTPEVATIMHLFIRRTLDSLAGVAEPGPVWRVGTLQSPITRHPLEHRFLWAFARIDDSGRVAIGVSDDQNCLSLNTFATANALVAIRSGAGQVAAGECVDYVSLE